MLNVFDQATASQVEEKTIVPRSMDLALHFGKFVEYWAGKAPVEYLGPAGDPPCDMTEEVSLNWTGTVGGTLVVRCHKDFLTWLKNSRVYKPSHLCTEREIFHEMVTLYVVRLIQSFWLSEIFELGLIVPRSSTPEKWPVREPNVTSAFLAGDHPVEIRFWMN